MHLATHFPPSVAHTFLMYKKVQNDYESVVGSGSHHHIWQAFANLEKRLNGELTVFIHQGAPEHRVHTAPAQQTNRLTK